MFRFRPTPLRSKAWRAFVRSLPCGCRDPRCPNCSWAGYSDVEAAHLRSQTGGAQKPSDILCYPLSGDIHRIFHGKAGHPSVAWQLARVVRVLDYALDQGVLVHRPEKGR